MRSSTPDVASPTGVMMGEDPEDNERRFHVTRAGVGLKTREMLGQTTPE